MRTSRVFSWRIMRTALPAILVSAFAVQGSAQNSRLWSSFNGGFMSGADNQNAVRANAGQPFIGVGGGGNSGFQSGFFTPFVIQSGQTTESIGMIAGWNMVSVPLTVNNYAKAALFPSAVSSAFSYSGAYVVSFTLTNGTGYWVKFSAGQQVVVKGLPRARDTVNLRQGWNIIGSISNAIPTSSLVSIPGGIATSQFFGYDGAYHGVTTIEPGYAYWLKTNQSGKLVLASSTSGAVPGTIKIVPTTELPPEAPGLEESPLPKEFALEENYPNPFNPTTTIRYMLPLDSRVEIRVYDILGRTVATLVDEVQAAGFKSTVWFPASVASGTYLVRLVAEPLGGTPSFISTRKMLLLR